MDITLLGNDQTLKILSNPELISTWKLLANESQEFTLIQQHGFVSSWYKSYINKYIALLVIAYDDKKDIIGILPLAISKESGTLSHAGHFQAEYNGWVCKKEFEEEFLIQSVIAVKKEFHPNCWDWGWMPAHANTHWLHSEKLKKSGIHVNTSTCESPIYELNDTTRIDKIKKGKSTKSKINRLKRSGELRIERITDLSVAKEIFEDLKNIYDFRSLAAYNIMPFKNDHNKEKWHLDYLNNSNDVHFTVLWQGDKLLACNLGYCSDDTVVIGLFTYNPVQGAHSPGSVFLIMLIDFIKQEGYQYLDLSPGGDAYKERFCNKHNTLTKPAFCFSYYTKYKNSAKTYLINKIKERCTSRDIQNLKECYINKIKDVARLGKQSSSSQDEKLYLFDSSNTVNCNEIPDIHIQRDDDLLLYKPVKGQASHKEVIFSALKNFERGDSLYTLVKDKELLAYTWVSTSGKKHISPIINQHTTFTGSNPLLYNTCFSNKDKIQELFPSFLHTVITSVTNDLIESKKPNTQTPTEIYLSKPNWASDDQLRELGFSSVSTVKA